MTIFFWKRTIFDDFFLSRITKEMNLFRSDAYSHYFRLRMDLACQIRGLLFEILIRSWNLFSSMGCKLKMIQGREERRKKPPLPLANFCGSYLTSKVNLPRLGIFTAKNETLLSLLISFNLKRFYFLFSPIKCHESVSFRDEKLHFYAN